MSSVFAPIQYGWGVVYWLLIEGVPVVWIERETGLTLPTGYGQDASLVIDKSSDVGQLVDRESGLGAGYPLTFQLLDTVTIRSWLRKWSLSTEIALAVAWNDATIHVESITGWPAGGVFWLGLERIEYTGTADGGDPRFTGCTRGTAGSLASIHYPGTISGICTDLPRWWRGRQARLFASPMAPSSTMTGSSLIDEAAEVWRGVIDQGPDRVGGLWELQAQALDRRLDLQLTAKITGSVIDLAPRYAIEPSLSVVLQLKGWNLGPVVAQWEFWIELNPFAAMASGDLLTPAEQADAIKAAWLVALPLAKNLVSGLFDAANYLGVLVVAQNAGAWWWKVTLQAGAVTAPGLISDKISFNGSDSPGSLTKKDTFDLTPVAGQLLWLNWKSNGDHLIGHATMGALVNPGVSGIAVELDAPVPVGLSTYGNLKLNDKHVLYTKMAASGTLAFFAGLYAETNKTIDLSAVKIGDSVEVLNTNGGKAAIVLRELLSSSGTGQRGAYDTKGLGEGYGMDGSGADTSAVYNASFDKLAAGPLVALPVEVVTSGHTFAECFGGLLALSQRGVVVRGDDALGVRRQRLAMVSTEPGGGDYDVTITDLELLTTEGDSVTAVRKRDVPNTITVSIPQGSDSPDVFQIQDSPAAAQQGVILAEYELPFFGKATADQVTQWALARFVPAQTEQIIELKLVPWIDIDVGDLVRLELTHFAIWQWSTGTPGYTGNGRVLGVRRQLLDGSLTATILIDGTTQKLALCPAAVVVDHDGPAGAPTKIRIEQRFYQHLHKSLSLAATIDVWHFEAGLGDEAGGGGYTVSAVVDNGTDAELTVAAVLGGAVLSAYSWLTLPDTANATVYQNGFAHVSDGSSWG